MSWATTPLACTDFLQVDAIKRILVVIKCS